MKLTEKELTYLKNNIKKIPFFNLTDENREMMTSMVNEIIQLRHIIYNIANIDTIFIRGDGEDEPWDDKLALAEIESLVMPIWNEHCERTNKEFFGGDNDEHIDTD